MSLPPAHSTTSATAATSAPPSIAPTSHRRAVALMVLSAACYTANVLLIRALGDHGFNNVWLVSCARFLVGLAVVATVYRRDWRPANLWRNPKLINRGLTGGFGVYVTYLSIVKAGAGRATFINNTYVVWGALLAAWVLREKLRSSVLVGGVLAFVGLALLTNIFAPGSHASIYDGVAVVSALLSAWVVVTIRQLHATEHSSTIFAAQCVYGFALCFVPALLHPSPVSAFTVTLLVVAGLCAATGQMAMTLSFRDLGVAEGSLLQMLTPLGVGLGSVLFFAETFAPHELLGAALILAGCAFTALRR